MDHVRVAATGRALNYLPQRVAATRRIFENLGLEVTERVYEPWTYAVLALEAGEADAVLGGIWVPLMYRRIGRDYVSVAQLTSSCPLVLVRRRRSAPFDWWTMDGKVVIVPGGGHCAGFIALAAAMRDDGYDIGRTVPIHDVSEEFGVEMFVGGIGDFLVVPRLVAARIVDEVDAGIAASLALRAGQIPWSVYYARRDVARGRTESWIRFRAAIGAAMQWLATTPLPRIVEGLELASLPNPHQTAETIARYQDEDVWSGAEILDGPLRRWQESLQAAGLLDRCYSHDEAVLASSR